MEYGISRPQDLNNNQSLSLKPSVQIQTCIDETDIALRQKFQQQEVMHCITGLLFLLSSTLLWSLSQSTATPNYVYSSCDQRVNYTDGSIYRANVNLLLSTLYFNATNSNGFYNTTIGENPNMVYGLFLCRGDITSEECDQCIKVAGGNVTQFCPNEAVAIIWYDLCMLRYSNQFIFSTLQEYPSLLLYNVNNASNLVLYKQTLGDLMNGLVMRAAFNSTRMYAAGSANITGRSEMIYGLVQCTPDLSQNDCYTCLAQAFSSTDGIRDKQGGRCIMPSCNLRYESLSFYESSIAAPSPSATPAASPGPSPLATILSPPPLVNKTVTNGKGKTSSNFVIITVVVAITAVIHVSIFCIYFYMRRKPKNETDGNREIDDVDETIVVQSLQFDFDTIRAATDNFSHLKKLGQGGFGAVYKGKLLNGQEVAVKRLSRDSRQGELEFKNEVELMAKLEHRNLVRLLGFSFQGEERLLIYEFLRNKSLNDFIFDPIKCTQLDWEKRYKIIKGIARGLLYLHEDSQHRIIHRDLKASNVLLDEQMNPKISDFGMARLFVVDQTQNTSKIVGTYGYMAPEYAIHGFFSVKSDVFSFGVLLLEIISGQKKNKFYQLGHTEDFLNFAWRNWREGTVLKLMDTTLRGNCSTSEVMRCIHIGLLCVQENVADRPTMAQVDLMFNSSSITLSIPLSPPLFFDDSREADKSSSKNDRQQRVSPINY